MNPIYVEVSDEITTVIERMSGSPDPVIALVIPRGALLLQSLVNLKLAKKTAADAGKQLVLVTTDKIGRNLAAQVGLSVVSQLEDAGSLEKAVPADEGVKMIDGVKVHRYYEEGTGAPEEAAEGVEASGVVGATAAVEPIVPREIMKAKKTEEAPEEIRPITTREVKTDLPAAAESVDAPIEIKPTAEPTIATAAVDITPAVKDTPPTDDPLSMASASTPPAASPSNPRRRKFILLGVYVVILLLLAATGVSAFYLPKTEVDIIVDSQPWKKDTTIAATTGSPTLPSELITSQLDDTLTFSATGSVELGNKAQGTASVSNLDSSDPKLLPAGSQILANGLTFITQEKVTVPGASIVSGTPVPGTTNVQISAQAPGTASNLSQTPATVPGQKLFAQIISTTAGTSKVAAVVTDTDIANAKAALIKKGKDDVGAKLVASLKDRDVLFDPGTDIFSNDAFHPSVASGSQNSSGTVTATFTLKRLVADKAKATAAAKTSLTTSSDPSLTYVTEKVDFTKTVVDMAGSTVTLSATGQGRFSATIDPAPIRSQLVGKSRSAGEALLKTSVKNGQVVIKQQPSWWPIHNFPYSGKYLTVLVKYE
ncbi:MAG: hypothetical protein WCO52_05675 [bacterium]